MPTESRANSQHNTNGMCHCPYCGSTNTELLAAFGQQLLTAQMYCQDCHTPFEYIKDDHVLAAIVSRTRKGTQS